jgi:hypothetical protein
LVVYALSFLLRSIIYTGYVLQKTIEEIRESKPADISLWDHIGKIRDPATLAVLLEDGAACLGVVIAIAGISASHATGNPIYGKLVPFIVVVGSQQNAKRHSNLQFNAQYIIYRRIGRSRHFSSSRNYGNGLG